MLNLLVEVSAGSHITDAAEEAISLAKKTGCCVNFRFNGIMLSAFSCDCVEIIRSEYQRRLKDPIPHLDIINGGVDEKERGDKVKTELEELREKVAALTAKNNLLQGEILRKESEIAHWRTMALSENDVADILSKELVEKKGGEREEL